MSARAWQELFSAIAMLVFAAWLGWWLLGCAAPVVAAPLAVPEGKTFCTHVNVSAPGDAYSIAVACESGYVLAGACTIEQGGRIVEDATTGNGWGCSAVSARDAVRFCVNVQCEAKGVQ